MSRWISSVRPLCDRAVCPRESHSVKKTGPWEKWSSIACLPLSFEYIEQLGQRCDYLKQHRSRPWRKMAMEHNWMVRNVNGWKVMAYDRSLLIAWHRRVAKHRTNLWMLNIKARAAMVCSPPEVSPMSRHRLPGGKTWNLTPPRYGSYKNNAREQNLNSAGAPTFFLTSSFERLKCARPPSGNLPLLVKSL